MKLMRLHSAGEMRWVISDTDGIYWLEGDPFGTWTRGIEVASLAGVRFLAPCQPTKIIAIGLNYVSHAEEVDAVVPKEPFFFLKPPSSIVAHGGKVIHPANLSQRVDYEGELAVVMGKSGRDIATREASEYVLGYTCANDVTARDLQRTDPQWTRAKGFDTFCPLGPVIATDVDPSDLMIRTRLNGEVRQEASTSEMVFSVERLISYISAVMTLEAGDVILTGTPAGVGELKPGDRIEVEIESVGTLTNTVVEA
jgi:2-keto-4-pentenoate hydratase/2-oxohepta-3-ene-1,7-dioic acid hydratase in catechol pathway